MRYLLLVSSARAHTPSRRVRTPYWPCRGGAWSCPVPIHARSATPPRLSRRGLLVSVYISCASPLHTALWLSSLPSYTCINYLKSRTLKIYSKCRFRLQIQDISQTWLNSRTFFYTLSVANIRNQTQLCTLSGILFLWKKELYPIRSTIIYSLHHLTLIFSEISTVVSEHSNVQLVQRFFSFLKRIIPNIEWTIFPCFAVQSIIICPITDRTKSPSLPEIRIIRNQWQRWNKLTLCVWNKFYSNFFRHQLFFKKSKLRLK